MNLILLLMALAFGLIRLLTAWTIFGTLARVCLALMVASIAISLIKKIFDS